MAQVVHGQQDEGTQERLNARVPGEMFPGNEVSACNRKDASIEAPVGDEQVENPRPLFMGVQGRILPSTSHEDEQGKFDVQQLLALEFLAAKELMLLEK